MQVKYFGRDPVTGATRLSRFVYFSAVCLLLLNTMTYPLQEGPPRRLAVRRQDAQQGRKKTTARNRKVTAAKAQFKFRAPFLIPGNGSAVLFRIRLILLTEYHCRPSYFCHVQ